MSKPVCPSWCLGPSIRETKLYYLFAWQITNKSPVTNRLIKVLVAVQQRLTAGLKPGIMTLIFQTSHYTFRSPLCKEINNNFLNYSIIKLCMRSFETHAWTKGQLCSYSQKHCVVTHIVHHLRSAVFPFLPSYVSVLPTAVPYDLHNSLSLPSTACAVAAQTGLYACEQTSCIIHVARAPRWPESKQLAVWNASTERPQEEDVKL